MAADIDVRSVAAFTSIPEGSIRTLLDEPTKEAISTLLEAVAAKAKESDSNKSQRVKLEVELETHIRTTESKTKVLQNSRDKALADVSKLRVDLQNSENARARAESEVEQSRQNKSSETSEVDNLRTRITSLETSNRDTIALLDSKNATIASLREELSSEHSKIIELRKSVSSLEQTNQNASSAVASAKFREQSLEQELVLLKKNNDWLENERKIKADEHTNFRKEKNARISELTRSNEQNIEAVEHLQRSESSLKARLEEQVIKHEELLQTIQRLQEKEIAEADSHRIELDSVNRLAQLQEASATTAKQRVEELQTALEETKEDAAIEIGEIRAEVEAEHQDREAAEQRVAELETRIADLEHEIEQARGQPVTPRREINGHGLSTPLRPGTPSGIFSPAFSGRLKGSSGNLTVSQLYTEYKSIERDLANEKRINSELQSNIDSMLEDMEATKPEIEELREDQTRLQSEVFEMSTLVETANHERDNTVKQARLLQGQFEAISKELEDCKQSLRDRNSQLRWLIMDREAHQQGGSISEAEYGRLEQAALEADARDTEHLSDTQRIVNQQLVLFKSVGDLQQQNENQLITIRNLVGKLEDTQTKDMQLENHQLKQEIAELKTKISDYQDEIKRTVAQSTSFIKERDMLKTALSRRGQIDPKDFSRSMPLPAGESPLRGLADETMSSNVADYAKLLKDLQKHFDNYRQETSVDNTSLRTQLNDVTKRNSELQTEVSRAIGQLTAASQRYEMLQSNYTALKTENAEITKRSYAAMEAATKQEMRTQQAAEELIEAKGHLDSLRRESANLKAEKDLWKSVEKRLIEDNDSLRNERSRLDQMHSTLQNMLNERDHADSETRRRLQGEVESLTSELTSTKRKVAEEVEQNKQATQRREYELSQNQKRIDDLMTSLSATREELAAVKTTKDHLEARVDELTVELKSAEERLEVYTRPAEPTDNSHDASEEALSHEQELAVRVSELERDLELRTSELERANEQIEVFRGIAQAAEERLQELSESNDIYREETETVLVEKEKNIKNLEQRLEDISAELSTTNSELTALRDEHSESNRKIDEQKTFFEAEILRLKDSEDKALEQAQFNLVASKAQADIATEAQQNYENELVKHADAAKTLHVVRAEANQLRLDMVDLKTRVATAQGDLEQKESSWTDMKDRYEREVADLKKRRDEVAQQNSILHGQLESLTHQISALQKDRAALSTADSAEMSDSNMAGLGDLQEVIKYLRREKEIVDVQYHLSTQEAKRLRQQLDFALSQLDETRLKLDQQQRADADSERNAMSHKKLMDTLNELNVFRESSVTLRAEAREAKHALNEKIKKLEDLETEMQPLRARISELENLAELREGEMKLLQDDRDHWQQRCQNILSKYDRVDPAEMESLRANLSDLEKERDEAVAARTELESQIEAHPAQVEAAKADLRGRLAEQFKGQLKKVQANNREKQTELDTINAEKAGIQSELDGLKEQFEAIKSQNAAQAETEEPPSVTLPQNDLNSDGQLAELQAKIQELETQISEKDNQIASAAAVTEEKFKAREAQLKEVLNKRLAEFKQQANTAKEQALEELRQSLSNQHQQDLEALRSQSVPVAPELQQPTATASLAEEVTAVAPVSEPVPSSFDELLSTITEAQAKILVRDNETVRNILRANIRKSVEKEKETLREQLAASSTAAPTGEPSSSNEQLEKDFEAQKEAIIVQKEEEFTREKEQMSRTFDQQLEEERQKLIAQKDEELASERLHFSEESERKIAEQVANAQALAEKRASVKLNMAQNQARVANAKLEVVSKAAEETPEKAVKEVWEIAKVAKPAPVQAKPVAMPSAVPPSPTTNKPSAAPGTAAALPPPALNPTPVVVTTPAAETNGTAKSASEEVKAEIAPSQEAEVPKPASTAASNQAPAAKSALPQPRSASRASQGGAGPAQNAQGQGQAGRGSGIPMMRGGGRGRGNPRGGAQSRIPSTAGAGRGGAGNANLNPNASQFTPGGGNKRAREDGEASNDGNLGKRIRGGGQGGS